MSTEKLVSRFLSWPLPENVCSDPCASMPGYPHRTGTNLLTAEQAKAMLEHVLADDAAAADLVRTIEAKERMRTALVYVRHAVTEARRDGATAKFSIASINPDGSGQIKATFNVDAFLADVETVCGAPAQTDDDNLTAAALRFRQLFGLKLVGEEDEPA